MVLNVVDSDQQQSTPPTARRPSHLPPLSGQTAANTPIQASSVLPAAHITAKSATEGFSR